MTRRTVMRLARIRTARIRTRPGIRVASPGGHSQDGTAQDGTDDDHAAGPPHRPDPPDHSASAAYEE